MIYRGRHVETGRKGEDAKRAGPTWKSGGISQLQSSPLKTEWYEDGLQLRASVPGSKDHITSVSENHQGFCHQGETTVF